VFVRDSCEKIQHFGSHKDETGTQDEIDDEVCLRRLATTIDQVQAECRDVQVVLRRYYQD
jgi:osomolarity two-component system phosphorelay intermediate protein YPD1